LCTSTSFSHACRWNGASPISSSSIGASRSLLPREPLPCPPLFGSDELAAPQPPLVLARDDLRSVPGTVVGQRPAVDDHCVLDVRIPPVHAQHFVSVHQEAHHWLVTNELPEELGCLHTARVELAVDHSLLVGLGGCEAQLDPRTVFEFERVSVQHLDLAGN